MRIHQTPAPRFFIAAFMIAPLLLVMGSCTRLADLVGIPEDRGLANPILIPTPPPLTMPPELFLRPPANVRDIPAGAETDEAEEILLGGRAAPRREEGRALSEGERRLLERLKVDEAVDNIRELLDEDAQSRAYNDSDTLAILRALSEARRIERERREGERRR